MDFDTWHHKQLNGDADNCPHEAWERKAWDSAICECIKVAEKEAEDWEILRDISLARKESAVVEGTNILAINRCIDLMKTMSSNLKNNYVIFNESITRSNGS